MGKLSAVDGALREMAASRPWGVASLTLATALLPWIIAFTPPLLRSLQVGFATDAWRLLVGWLTTPVLFLLLNFVILSIWATSASDPRESSSQVEASAAILGTGEISKRKETILVLPPVSPIKSSLNLQASVFTRSPPQLSLAEEAPEPEEEVLSSREPLTLSDDSSSASSQAEKTKISPPPPPSFLVEHQQKIKQQKFLRRNSDSGVKSSASSKPRTRRTLSERSGRSSSISFSEAGEMSNVVESTDELRMRFESVIANFHAQLRLQTRSE